MAKIVNVAPSTLRYYDKEGLLPFLGSAQVLEKPVLIAEQGSFFAGGNVKQEAGSFDFQAPAKSILSLGGFCYIAKSSFIPPA